MNVGLPPPLVEERALHVAAFVALIDHTLSDAARFEAQPYPRSGASLIWQLERCGLADLSISAPGIVLIVMFGIGAAAHATEGTVGLLRNWQSAARTCLAQGVQK